jgi:two-component system cell cycle sensor histidine kinase/response regulator CckA
MIAGWTRRGYEWIWFEKQIEEAILVAEDEPLVLHLINEVLLGQGYHVLQAANGADALAIAQLHAEEPIDLLITEVVLPQMDGIELAQWLRTMYLGIKALFISGYDDIVASEDLQPFGEFLGKPFTPSILATTVRELLANQSEL